MFMYQIWQTMKNPNYKESLLARVKQALDPSAKDNPMDEINEARLMQFVSLYGWICPWSDVFF